MTTHAKTSILVNSQVPFYVRNDHQTFVSFLEAYYRYLEQNESVVSAGKVIDRAKNVMSFYDIDKTLDDLTDHLYDEYLSQFPKTIVADKKIVLKHAKDFYRSKGSENSIRFLMRAIFNKEIDIYYPKNDVLRASAGKWYIQKSLRVSDTVIDGSANNALVGLEKYVGKSITGNTSNASAIVESVNRYFQIGTQVDELILSSIHGTFESGETIRTIFEENDEEKLITSDIFAGVLGSVTIVDSGLNYNIGDPVIVSSNTGNGACVIVSQVSTGSITDIAVLKGGAGFRSEDFLFVAGDGTGANAKILLVNTDESVHPNTYNIGISFISEEANTPIGNAVYSNLSSSNANTTLANALATFVYANTGPARSISIVSKGTGYTTPPTMNVIANTRITALGILGQMEIIDGGLNYLANDKIEFINIPGGYGIGGFANVTSIEANGKIKTVAFEAIPGHIPGGSGYDRNYMPIANVVTSTGNSANIIVLNLLGYGAEFSVSNSSIGTIEKISIIDGGSGYDDATLDLSGSGDGNANAIVEILKGVFTYPGRYLNDDGHLSSFNFLQDRDYYQNYSYVIRVKESIENYRSFIKNLAHPAGMKMFGEYLFEDNGETQEITIDVDNSIETKFKLGTFNCNNSNIRVTHTSHGLVANDIVYLEFMTSNTPNGRFTVTTVPTANTFNVVHYSSVTQTSGSVFVGIVA